MSSLLISAAQRQYWMKYGSSSLWATLVSSTWRYFIPPSCSVECWLTPCFRMWLTLLTSCLSFWSLQREGSYLTRWISIWMLLCTFDQQKFNFLDSHESKVKINNFSIFINFLFPDHREDEAERERSKASLFPGSKNIFSPWDKNLS